MEPKQSPLITLDTDTIPSWLPYLHKQIVEGNGASYKEITTRALTMIYPSEKEKETFPALKDVTEVWIIYARR